MEVGEKTKHSEPACQVILAWGHLSSRVAGNRKCSIYFGCVNEGPGDTGVSRVLACVAPPAGRGHVEEESQSHSTPHRSWRLQN